MKLPTEKTKPQTTFKGFNTLIHGLPKIGKTTFAASLGDDVIIAATEKGYSHLSVFAVDTPDWSTFLDLAKSLNDSNFTTVVIDTVDILYKHCSAHVCKAKGWQDPSDGGYGKGFNLVRDEFMRVLNKMHQSGLSLIFISHSKEKTLKKKNGAEFTCMSTSMSPATELLVAGMADFVFYVHVDEHGQRWIATKSTPHLLAGDRSGKLPDRMPLDFALIQKYLSGELVKTEQQQKGETK